MYELRGEVAESMRRLTLSQLNEQAISAQYACQIALSLPPKRPGSYNLRPSLPHRQRFPILDSVVLNTDETPSMQHGATQKYD